VAEICDLIYSIIDWVSTGSIPLSITLSQIEIFVLFCITLGENGLISCFCWLCVKFVIVSFSVLRKAKLLQAVKGKISEN